MKSLQEHLLKFAYNMLAIVTGPCPLSSFLIFGTLKSYAKTGLAQFAGT